MLNFGPVKKPTNFTFVFDPMSGKESELGVAVAIAWDAVPETTRDLMLLCWSGLNTGSVRHRETRSPTQT